MNPGEKQIGKYVVVRTDSAGVHAGVLVARSGKEVELTQARRIYEWEGAFTLSEVATVGISKRGSRVAVEIPEIVLTEAIEVITASPAGEAAIRAANDRGV